MTPPGGVRAVQHSLGRMAPVMRFVVAQRACEGEEEGDRSDVGWSK
jgi:hypothetical protein